MWYFHTTSDANKDNLLKDKTIEIPRGEITWMKAQFNGYDEDSMSPELPLFC